MNNFYGGRPGKDGRTLLGGSINPNDSGVNANIGDYYLVVDENISNINNGKIYKMTEEGWQEQTVIKGAPFSISKTYASIDDMLNEPTDDYLYTYVMVKSNVGEVEHAMVFMRVPEGEGEENPTYIDEFSEESKFIYPNIDDKKRYLYLTDMSGKTGLGIKSIDTMGVLTPYKINEDVQGKYQEYKIVNTSPEADNNVFTNFKVYNGHGITDITGPVIDALEKTYTIKTSDPNIQKAFTVVDGRGIISINAPENSGQWGHSDTYTIKYNDGTTSTFDLKNGDAINVTSLESSEGLVDTYVFETFAGIQLNGFTVTNGRSIVSINAPENTNQQGQIDTYTINYNDRTTSTFNVQNGHGITRIEGPIRKGDTGPNSLKQIIKIYTSLSSVPIEIETTDGDYVINTEKKSSNGLIDTYNFKTILGNTLDSAFTVTNGRGIKSIDYTGSGEPGQYGQKDIYTITYNDNTTSTFSVQNGDNIESLNSFLTKEDAQKTYATIESLNTLKAEIANANYITSSALQNYYTIEQTESYVTEQLKNFNAKPFEISATAPTNTEIFWINSSNNNALYFYNGTSWELIPAMWDTTVS